MITVKTTKGEGRRTELKRGSGDLAAVGTAMCAFANSEGGVTAIAQPGGSIRDEEVIAAADAAGLAMVFTGARHFRH